MEPELAGFNMQGGFVSTGGGDVVGGNKIVNIIFAGERGWSCRLRQRHGRAHEPRTLTELLNPEYPAIDFIGRAAELEQLRQWCGGDEPLSVWCVTGDAGAGKTRIALEFCARQEAGGWLVGFLDEGGLAPSPTGEPAVGEASKPILAVVDYAATKRDRFKALLSQLADPAVSASTPKIRVLLLERQADAGSGWWAELLGQDSSSQWGHHRLFFNQAALALSILGSVDEQRHIAGQTMTKAAAILDLPCPAIDGTPDIEHEQRIARAGPVLPLKLMMAACLAVIRQGPLALDQRIATLAHDLAAYEQGRFSRVVRDRVVGDPAGLTWLASGITALDGLPSEELVGFVRTEIAENGNEGGVSALALADVLADLLPAKQVAECHCIDALRPDLIGEAFVLRALNGRSGRSNPRLRQAALSAVLRWYGRSPAAVAAFLIRTVQDFADVADHVALRWFDAAIGATPDRETLSLISDAMPTRSIHFRSRAVRILESQLELSGNDALTEATLADRARLHHNLSVRKSQLGDVMSGLDHAEEAAEGYRALVRMGALRYEGDLGIALCSVANRWLTKRQFEKARLAAEEAVILLTAIVEAGDLTRRSDLSLSLNALALCLSACDEPEAAVGAARKAVEYLTELAAEDPATFEPDLAIALGGLSHRLINVGQSTAAHDAALKAAEIAYRLADTRPDAFEPELATTLNSLSLALMKLGLRQQALDCAIDIVSIYRRLILFRPDPFRSDLSVALNNLANCYGALHRWSEVRAPAIEAFEWRQLVDREGSPDRLNLAASHLTLGQMFGNVGDHEQAQDHAEKAVVLYRVLAGEHDGLHRPDLAIALDTAATRAVEAGRPAEGRRWSLEAVSVHRLLARARPAIFAGHLAIALNNLANVSHTLGLEPQALKLGRQAVALYRRLAKTNPDFYHPGLAQALSNLSAFLAGMDHDQEAYDRAAQSVALGRSLQGKAPDAWTGLLAGSLVSLAIRARALPAQQAEALGYAREAVERCRWLTDRQGGNAPAVLPRALILYANCLVAAKPLSEETVELAIETAIESIANYHALFTKHPDAVRTDFAKAWASLAEILWDAGHREESQSAQVDAMTVLAPAFIASPGRYFDVMRPIVSRYYHRCGEMKVKPDPAALEPIIRAYNAFQAAPLEEEPG